MRRSTWLAPIRASSPALGATNKTGSAIAASSLPLSIGTAHS